MTRRRTMLLIGLPGILAVTLGLGAVWAQSEASDGDDPPATGDQERMWHGHQAKRDPGKFMQQRLDRLHCRLKITPEQEAQWNAFSQAVIGQMEQFKAARKTMSAPPRTAPERIDRHLQLIRQRAASFEIVAAAANQLYAALTPEQQRIADERLLRFHRHHHGHATG